MRINDIYEYTESTKEIEVLKKECGQFLSESEGNPLLKNLSISIHSFHKVKVRKRKNDTGEFTQTFNEAFESKHPGLRQRAIFANGLSSFRPVLDEKTQPCYIFPIDGYKFMYSREVENSGHEYKQVFETLFEQFGEEKGNEVLTDLLRFTYTSENLSEGIESGSEIIIYGIPYFYAYDVSSAFNGYPGLLSKIGV